MLPKTQLIPGAFSELLASVADTGTLTKADRYGLMAALLDESLDEESQMAANRLLRAVSRGKVKVLDRIEPVDIP